MKWNNENISTVHIPCGSDGVAVGTKIEVRACNCRRLEAKISEARKVLEAVKDSDADVSEEINKALEILICVVRIVKPRSNQNQ